MRMWHKKLIPFLCIKHRNGYHFEIHKHRHNFVKKHSITGRIYPVVQIEPEAMKERHDELALLIKGHKSPYEQPDLSYLPDDERYAKINYEQDLQDLCNRCEDCRKNLEGEMI